MGKVVAWLWRGETQQVSFPALCALLRSSKAAVPFRAYIGEEKGVEGQLGEHSPHPQEIEVLPPSCAGHGDKQPSHHRLLQTLEGPFLTSEGLYLPPPHGWSHHL